MSVCSQKKLVLQLRKLATTPEHCKALAQNEQCVKTLVQTLESPDQETVLYCVQTLLIIAQNQTYRAGLRKHQLKKSLQFLIDSPNTEISSCSKKLWLKLFPAQNHSHKVVHRQPTRSTQRLRKITFTLKDLTNPSRRKELLQICSSSPIITSYTHDEKRKLSHFFVQRGITRTQIQNFLEQHGFEETLKANVLKARGSNTQLKRYTQRQTKTTLKERLQKSQKIKEEKEQSAKETHSFLSYIW